LNVPLRHYVEASLQQYEFQYEFKDSMGSTTYVDECGNLCDHESERLDALHDSIAPGEASPETLSDADISGAGLHRRASSVEILSQDPKKKLRKASAKARATGQFVSIVTPGIVCCCPYDFMSYFYRA
jgi:hypothetical protein